MKMPWCAAGLKWTSSETMNTLSRVIAPNARQFYPSFQTSSSLITNKGEELLFQLQTCDFWYLPHMLSTPNLANWIYCCEYILIIFSDEKVTLTAWRPIEYGHEKAKHWNWRRCWKIWLLYLFLGQLEIRPITSPGLDLSRAEPGFKPSCRARLDPLQGLSHKAELALH